MTIKNHSFLSLLDFSSDEINYLLDFAIKLKKEKKNNIYRYRLKNKNVALIFEKTSTRTRCAASVACIDEGAHPEFLGKSDIQMGKKESIRDTARVLGRIFDCIIFRGYKQETLKKLSEFSNIPVINGLTDEEHPTQIIADFMTMKERFSNLNNIKISFLGDARNNVARSLIIGCIKMNIDISIASPRELWPDEKFNNLIRSVDTRSNLIFTIDPFESVKDSNVIYTDVWVSMGEENDPNNERKLELLKKYQVNKKIMDSTNRNDTIFLHCLPASHDNEHHSLEVTEEVFESQQSLVFDQAENRLHSLKAILVSMIGEKK